MVVHCPLSTARGCRHGACPWTRNVDTVIRLIFVPICGELSSLCAPTTGPSSGFKSFAIVTVCWLACICFSVSSRSRSNTDRDLSTLMRMAFHVSVVSVYDRIARWDHQPSVLSRLDLPRKLGTNLLLNRRWGGGLNGLGSAPGTFW